MAGNTHAARLASTFVLFHVAVATLPSGTNFKIMGGCNSNCYNCDYTRYYTAGATNANGELCLEYYRDDSARIYDGQPKGSFRFDSNTCLTAASTPQAGGSTPSASASCKVSTFDNINCQGTPVATITLGDDRSQRGSMRASMGLNTGADAYSPANDGSTANQLCYNDQISLSSGNIFVLEFAGSLPAGNYFLSAPAAAPSSSSGSSSRGDPHLKFASGGEADFRGKDQCIFCFVTAPNLQLNVMTEDRVFKRWNGQVVNGSFVTQAFVTAASKATNATARVAIFADQWGDFRVYNDENMTEHYNATRLFQRHGSLTPSGMRQSAYVAQEPYPDIEMMQMTGGRTFFKAAGWVGVVQRRRLRQPLVGGETAPRDHHTRYFLDTSFSLADFDSALVEKVGRSSVGWIAPHGVVGQSFDGSKIAVSGKLDKYGEAPAFTTSAQAEGAIEGNYKDYIMPSPFSTDFKFARFTARAPIAPRNVTALGGFKAASQSDGLSAQSSEQHGVEASTAAA